MAPVPITEDHYKVLDVAQTATPEQVYQSYKQRALKIHPDRNGKSDTTEAFQLLGNAYETLKDESKRRAYDRIYPCIAGSRPYPQSTQTSRPPPTSTSQREIRRLQQIQKLDTVTATEAADGAHQNSWGAWLLSPIFKRTYNIDELACKDRKKQERKFERDMKETCWPFICASHAILP